MYQFEREKANATLLSLIQQILSVLIPMKVMTCINMLHDPMLPHRRSSKNLFCRSQRCRERGKRQDSLQCTGTTHTHTHAHTHNVHTHTRTQTCNTCTRKPKRTHTGVKSSTFYTQIFKIFKTPRLNPLRSATVMLSQSSPSGQNLTTRLSQGSRYTKVDVINYSLFVITLFVII